MIGTKGTGRGKEIFLNTATTADGVTPSFVFSYHSTCTVKIGKCHYSLFNWG